jgi:putative FmdB family regulatory protein
MPKYEFRCNGCGMTFDERRPFSQASAAATCPTCQSEDTRKLFNTVTIFSYNSTASERSSFPSALAAQNQKTCTANGCGCGNH